MCFGWNCSNVDVCQCVCKCELCNNSTSTLTRRREIDWFVNTAYATHIQDKSFVFHFNIRQLRLNWISHARIGVIWCPQPAQASVTCSRHDFISRTHHPSVCWIRWIEMGGRGKWRMFMWRVFPRFFPLVFKISKYFLRETITAIKIFPQKWFTLVYNTARNVNVKWYN